MFTEQSIYSGIAAASDDQGGSDFPREERQGARVLGDSIVGWESIVTPSVSQLVIRSANGFTVHSSPPDVWVEPTVGPSPLAHRFKIIPHLQRTTGLHERSWVASKDRSHASKWCQLGGIVRRLSQRLIPKNRRRVSGGDTQASLPLLQAMMK
jgi:hypothetical protein